MNEKQKQGIIVATALIHLSREFESLPKALSAEFGEKFYEVISAAADQASLQKSQEEQEEEFEVFFVNAMRQALQDIAG